MSEVEATAAATSLRDASRFVGRWQNKIDTKGRISVPADFRRHLAPGSEDPAPSMYCCPSFSDAELICGGADLVTVHLEIVATQDIFEKKRAAMERAVTAFTERLYFDDNGRIVLPKKLRDHAGLEGQVAFAGAGPFFTMSPGECLDDLWDLVTSLTEDERDIIRARSMPSTIAGRGKE
ncbi:division/cell wall cluster transcriptional repressor MraZ [Parvularcula marina]|uniref:division/cell wall cluster transcriptional repressor MraZ n=1 Tax=Parvularcula marina TaxID=2292771 RepID=UPI003518B34B